MNGADQCKTLDVNELRNGQLEAIKARVEAGADVNCPIPQSDRSDYDRPLAWALSRPRLEIVQYLVAQGANIDDVSRRGDTSSGALEVLVAQDSECMDVANFLLERVHEPAGEVLGRVFLAALKKLHWSGDGTGAANPSWHVELMRKLIERGLDKDGIDMRQAVHDAVWQPRTLELLLSEFNAKADPEAEHQSYPRRSALEPPIITAILNGSADAVRVLLRHGADPDKKDSQGVSALHIAAARGEAGIVEQLLAAGANPEPRDSTGRSPLFHAQRRQHQATIDVFARHKISIDPAEERILAEEEAMQARAQRAEQWARMGRNTRRVSINLLVILLWAAYLGAVLWAESGEAHGAPLAAAVLDFNLWAGPLLAAVSLGAIAGFAFTALFTRSHHGYAAVANGLPIGIGAGAVTLITLAVLNYLFRGENQAIALVAPVLTVGLPIMAVAARRE